MKMQGPSFTSLLIIYWVYNFNRNLYQSWSSN